MTEDKMQYIDDFFQGKLSGDEGKLFGEKITRDPSFAADVAFYLSSRQVAHELANEEKKKRFKELYTGTNGKHTIQKTGKVRVIRYAMYVAMAAAVLAAIIVTFSRSDSPKSYADAYISKNYAKISPTMGKQDEMQKAVDLYNEGKFVTSLAAFENIISKDSTLFYPLEYAGLAALQIPEYDKALQYFSRLEKFHAHSNPAVLLQAVTLMKRNQSGDKQQARLLLKKVKDHDLDGKETAEKWLEEMD